MTSHRYQAVAVADAATYRAAQALSAQAATQTSPGECWAEYKGQQAAEEYVRWAGCSVALEAAAAHTFPDQYTQRAAYLQAHNDAYAAAYAAVMAACAEGSRMAAQAAIDEIRSRYVPQQTAAVI